MDDNKDNAPEKLDTEFFLSRTAADEAEKSLDELVEKATDEGEHYDFTWAGKAEALAEMGRPVRKILRPDPENSINFAKTENLYIEGDNLDALKLLQESYLGKVKMIYIDPPYNTGKDFVYHDNFRQSADEYDEATERIDADGNKNFKKNDKTNGRFHSDWLSMMLPRLKLARNLLSDDGVIFISIDDNEQANLKLLCDEVFGEENFLATIIWERAYAPINLMHHFSPSHDYCLVYARKIDMAVNNGFQRTDEADARYQNPDNDPRGVWKSSDMSVGPAIEANIYPITTPSGRVVEPPAGRSWSLSRNAFRERLEDNRIWFGSTGNNVPAIKRFKSDLRKTGITPMTIWKYTDVGHSQSATQELKDIFDGKAVMDYPKPVEYIKRMLELYTKDDDIICDFFSGSGTTAHSVMKLNAEDGGTRKFILVQLPEATPENSEARKAGYNTIPEIARERIKRAGAKILKQVQDDKGAGAAANLDVGFRRLVIDSVNEKDGISKPAAELQQSLIMNDVDNIKPDRQPLDFLFGALCRRGMEYNKPLRTAKIGENTVYFYDYFEPSSGVIACFDEDLPENLIKTLAEKRPNLMLLRETAFNSASAKVNVVEQFRILSPDTLVRTV
jgi:adenine-specific DNA-methyltransferase